MEIQSFIKGLGQYDNARLEKTDASNAKSRRGKAASAEKNGDRINFSSEGKLRTEAHRVASEAPDIRRQKVEEIKARVQSGEYQIDAHKIAEKLVKDDLELFL